MLWILWKIIQFLVLAIVAGVLGNLVWDWWAKSRLTKLRDSVLNASTLWNKARKDQLYALAARRSVSLGRTHLLMTLTVSVSVMAVVVTQRYPYMELHYPRLISWTNTMWLALILGLTIMFMLTAGRLSYVSSVIADFEWRLTIFKPFMSVHDMDTSRARFALMDTAAEYYKLLEELAGVARAAQAKLAEEERLEAIGDAFVPW